MKLKAISLIVCALMIVTIFAVATPVKAFDVKDEEWLRTYNGYMRNRDQAGDIALDSSGNIFVAGDSIGSSRNYDFLIVSYDSNGLERWDARYNGPGNDDDFIGEIAVDSVGNVYVAGASMGSGTNYDYVVVSYDNNGVHRWTERYNGPGNYIDTANTIDVDQYGNVYVAGNSEQYSVTGRDIAIISYDSNGNHRWTSTYSGPGNNLDTAYEMVIDESNERIYLTGYSHFDRVERDYITLAYNYSGSELWAERYAEGEIANAIDIDIEGNVYITGIGHQLPSYNDITTVSYDSDGNMRWMKNYNGIANGVDNGMDIAVDSMGNVNVIGKTQVTSYINDQDYIVFSFDNNGNQRWTRSYNGPGNIYDCPFEITTDKLNNIYITGQSWGGYDTYYDITTISYDLSGRERWISREDGDSSGSDYGHAIALDSNGNAYVVGFMTTIEGGEDFATIKYVPWGPYADAGDDQYGSEGEEIFFDASESYDIEGWPLSYHWDFDGDFEWDFESQSPIASWTWYESGSHDVWVWVSNNQTLSSPNLAVAYVENIEPTTTAGGTYYGDEGDSISVMGEFTDIGTDTHTANWDWGDGTTSIGEISESITATASTGVAAGNHTYGEDGAYTVTLTVTDSEGGSSSDTLTINIDNVAPTVSLNGDITINEGFILSISGTFSDPGWLDSHTANWNWGDGTISAGAVTEENDEPYATGTVNGAHQYVTPGNYQIILTVIDDMGSGNNLVNVTVNNNAPIVTSLNASDYNPKEGNTVDFVMTFSDYIGTDDVPYTITWNFGDGTGDYDNLGQAPSYVYNRSCNPDGSNFTVTVTVTDCYGAIGQKSICIEVENLLPIVEIGQRFEFEAGIDDDWVPEGQWIRENGVYHCPTNTLRDSYLTSKLFAFNRNQNEPEKNTQIFKFYIKHKLDLDTMESAEIRIWRGGDIKKTITYNSDFDWTLTPINMTSYMGDSSSTFRISFIFHTRAIPPNGDGWKIDFVDVIGLDNLNIGINENVHFLAEAVCAGSDSIVGWQWNFSNGDSSNAQNPTISFRIPVGMAYLNATDDDGYVVKDQGIGSVIIEPVNAERQISSFISEIGNLPDNCFSKNPSQLRSLLQQKFTVVMNQIEKGYYLEAISKLNNDILPKLDGSVGGSDKDDWIIDPLVQQELINGINDLIFSIQYTYL